MDKFLRCSRNKGKEYILKARDEPRQTTDIRFLPVAAILCRASVMTEKKSWQKKKKKKREKQWQDAARVYAIADARDTPASIIGLARGVDKGASCESDKCESLRTAPRRVAGRWKKKEGGGEKKGKKRKKKKERKKGKSQKHRQADVTTWWLA